MSESASQVPDLDALRAEAGGPLSITLLEQAVLHAPAAEVTVFDQRLADLVDEMFRTMYLAPGVGLAATQVGIGLRVFVYDCGDEHGGPGHVVNPVLERLSDELQEDPEGCLSVPGVEADTVRALDVRCTGVDVAGARVEVVGHELLARCLQHETDHLDGLLYLDRVGGRTRRRALREARGSDWYGDAVRVLHDDPGLLPGSAPDPAQDSPAHR